MSPSDGQQQTRRKALLIARDALRLGATLAKQRDTGKRSYDDMNDADQQVLHDYETGRIKRAKQDFSVPKMKPFQCKPQPFLVEMKGSVKVDMQGYKARI